MHMYWGKAEILYSGQLMLKCTFWSSYETLFTPLSAFEPTNKFSTENALMYHEALRFSQNQSGDA